MALSIANLTVEQAQAFRTALEALGLRDAVSRNLLADLSARVVALENAQAKPPAPTLSLSSAVTKAEGDSGSTAFVWTLTLNRDGSNAAFPYAWMVGAIGANPANVADFGGAFPSGSGAFAAGETSKTISVPVTGDTAVEPAESFSLTVSGSGLNTVTSMGTISNDDAAPLPTLTLAGPLTFTAATAPGTTVANIGNVPAGATPTISPNDGRLAVAGNETDGWHVVVGLSASSAGTITLTVSAAGANPATANLAVAPAPTPAASLRIATTNNEIDRAAGSAATSANLKQVCRKRKFIGSADASTLVISASSFLVPTPSTLETAGPAYVARADLEINGVCIAATWDGGATSKAIAAGASDVQSDPFTPAQFGLSAFPAGAQVWVKLEREYAVGALPTYQGLSAYSVPIAGESTLRAATGTASKIGTAGPMASGSGWASTAAHFGPVLLGISTCPAFGIMGGSIEYCTNDPDGSGGEGTGGYLRRALMTGTKIAFMNMAKGSDSAYTFVAGFARRQAYFKYFTHALEGYGGNDFTDNKTAAQLVADKKTISAALKAAGVPKIYQIRLYPKSDSTDNWATLANQTVRTNSSGTGFLAFRAAVDAGMAADPNTTGMLDVTPAVESQAEPGKWQAATPPKTPEGTHPETAAHGDMGVLSRPLINAIL
jgi:hypothetical protein